MRLDRNKVQLRRKDDDAHNERGGNQVLHNNNDQFTKLLTGNIFSGSSMHMSGHVEKLKETPKFQGLPIEASFTPDSQFVVSGSTDGLLHLWRTEDGRSAGVLTGEHQV